MALMKVDVPHDGLMSLMKVDVPHDGLFFPIRPERAEAPSPGHRPG